MNWSPGFRFFVVGALAVLMLIPSFFVAAVIDERAGYSRQTIASVGREWGGAQTIGAPRLIIPVEAEVEVVNTRKRADPITGEIRYAEEKTAKRQEREPVIIYPEALDVAIDLTAEERARGVFTAPVYSANAVMSLRFDPTRAALSPKETALWDKAKIEISVSDARGLRGATGLVIDGKPVPLEGASIRQRGVVYALIGDPRQAETYELTMAINGAQSLFLSPGGRATLVEMTANWPDPSFGGAFLPDGSDVREDGFSATWTIPHLATGQPVAARGDASHRAADSAFGVRLIQPNDIYQRAYRAARYNILFIAMTFLIIMLMERAAARPIHPVQYVLVGVAQAIFLLLLTAYAEQIGFAWAYLFASGATGGLLTLFGASALVLGRRTWWLAGALAGLYGVMYATLQSADHALLIGASLAFAAVAAMMLATRNDQWFGRGGGGGLRWPLRRRTVPDAD